MESRTPIFIGSRANGDVFVAEALAVGYSVWREGDFAAFGQSPGPSATFCGSGGQLDFLGCIQGTRLSADDLRQSNSATANFTIDLQTQVTTLTNYVSPTGVVKWIAARDGPAFVRQTHDGGTRGTLIDAGTMRLVQEAATDSTQTVWWSGVESTGRPTLLRLEPDSDTPGLETLSTQVPDGPVQVSARGNHVVAGWIEGPGTLVLVMRGGWTGRTTYNLFNTSYGLRDLKVSGDSIVALLEGSGTTRVLVHRPEGASSFEIQGITPVAIDLGLRLSIVGFCSGMCPAVDDNPVDQWFTRPDGGAW